ncbi:unnamed protein product [Choristocarpus tenellus]
MYSGPQSYYLWHIWFKTDKMDEESERDRISSSSGAIDPPKSSPGETALMISSNIPVYLRAQYMPRFTASWRCTIFPLRASVTQAQARWSERVESARKNVKCFFGRVKGCYRILKLPLLYSHMKKIDNIFFTCCILQNMPYSYDGLGEFEGNIDWTGDAGLHDAFYSDPYTDFTQMGMPKDQGRGT